eukprot:1607147-Pyramimonas_sp.AAC.1
MQNNCVFVSPCVRGRSTACKASWSLNEGNTSWRCLSPAQGWPLLPPRMFRGVSSYAEQSTHCIMRTRAPALVAVANRFANECIDSLSAHDNKVAVRCLSI